MVIDAFMFFNELDLLEIRLNILDPYVDKFVIVEARHTFMGKEKLLYYLENKERFAKWNDKIIHYIVDDISEKEWNKAKLSPNVGAGEHWWVREFSQKENILKALTQCRDDDVIFVSDLDEIWNPEAISLAMEKDRIYKCKQIAYHYYLNNHSDQDINGWVGTHFGTYAMLKKYGVNHFRNKGNNPIIIENGGWHFTFMGGEEAIKTKIEAYSHQEYNTPKIRDNIEENIRLNKDFLNRGFNLWKDESELPKYLIKNKEKWKNLFL